MPAIRPLSFFPEPPEHNRVLARPPRAPQIQSRNAALPPLPPLTLTPAALSLSQEAEPNNRLSSGSIFALPTAAGSQEDEANRRLSSQRLVRTLLFSSAQSEILPDELPEADKDEGNNNRNGWFVNISD